MTSKTTATLSEYERKRAENIERNNDRLRALGLISTLEEERSNAAAWGKQLKAPALLHDADAGIRKKKRQTEPCQPARKSRRLKGDVPEHDAKDDIDAYDAGSLPRSLCISTFDLSESECNARVRECRESRQRAALEIAEGGDSSKNPTATYAHCLMRVRSMTEKALESRVKAIERAMGKHCVLKMAIFKSCLQDEGMLRLAKMASDALERLKALEPPPK
jgi:hypothetical protein